MKQAGVALRRSPSVRAIFNQAGARRRLRLSALLATALAFTASGAAASDHSSSTAAAASMIYVDTALAPSAAVQSRRGESRVGAQRHPLYRQLRSALNDYRSSWGMLPPIEVPQGPVLKAGASGDRVDRLRERLGLYPFGSYDSEVEQKVRDFQVAHGLPDDGIAGRQTIEALNRGAGHYERLIQANLERAAALPANPGRRYVLVDAASAMLWMYEDGQPVDSMRVIVGKPSEQTPMLAAYLRYAVLNPYWNVPPDLVRRNIAPNARKLGSSWLEARGYETLSGWERDAQPVDPSTIDWEAVAKGDVDVRVRQRPGSGNMMGEAKFMISDDLGIFLHDTPNRALFDEPDRRLSSGCIRLEDVERLAEWLFDGQARPDPSEPEFRVDLPEPVPVLVTYLTTSPAEDGLVFRNDIYGRDNMTAQGLAP